MCQKRSPQRAPSGLRQTQEFAGQRARFLLASLLAAPFRGYLSSVVRPRSRPRRDIELRHQGVRQPRGTFVGTQLATEALTGSLIRQHTHDGDVFEQLVREVVSVLEICRIIVADPHFSLGVFPDERLQGQVNRNGGRGLH